MLGRLVCKDPKPQTNFKTLKIIQTRLGKGRFQRFRRTQLGFRYSTKIVWFTAKFDNLHVEIKESFWVKYILKTALFLKRKSIVSWRFPSLMIVTATVGFKLS